MLPLIKKKGRSPIPSYPKAQLSLLSKENQKQINARAMAHVWNYLRYEKCHISFLFWHETYFLQSFLSSSSPPLSKVKVGQAVQMWQFSAFSH